MKHRVLVVLIVLSILMCGIPTAIAAEPSDKATYSVLFNGSNATSGSTAALPPAVAGTWRVLPESAFRRSNMAFVGWRDANAVYQSGEAFLQPGQTVTLYAVWQTIYAVSGTVRCAQQPASETEISLFRGNTLVASATAAENGTYQLQAPLGSYQLQMRYAGRVKTTWVNITTENRQSLDLTLPAQNTNSDLQISADCQDILLGDWSACFEDAGVYRSEDRLLVQANGSVTLRMNLQLPESAATRDIMEEVAANNGDKLQQFFCLQMQRRTADAQGVEQSEDTLDTLPMLYAVTIPIPGAMQHMSSFLVYRSWHQQVQVLSQTPNLNGEYLRVNSSGTSVTVYVKRLGTFALGGANSYALLLDACGGICADRCVWTAADAQVPPLPTPTRAGYVFDGWYTQPQGGDGLIAGIWLKEDTVAYAHWKPWENPYTDVQSSQWFYEPVRYAAVNGLFTGTTATTFSPDKPMSRGMMVTVLYRMQGSPVVTAANPFSDVPAAAYYADPITWAAAHEIVTGYTNGKFGPDEPITRQQMAAILYRYASYLGLAQPADTKVLAGFTDTAQITPYALQPISWAVAQNLIHGITPTTLAPLQGATRAQVAMILMNYQTNLES